MAIHASTTVSLVPGAAPRRVTMGTISEADDPARVGRWFVCLDHTVPYAYEGDSKADALGVYRSTLDDLLL